MSFLWIATQVFRLARNDEVVFGLLKKLRYACFATIALFRVESYNDENICIASSC
ncbi:hypothetical protein [Helicobacter sp. MIT 01-3238]|uniref:hypothetical protein n=1 Tax=Helicobacter sp. MIT 01-3238 TaxID=398627 RepID=UPI0015F1507E|nr:hypothetical protein [Helicobacter sp. MIT 01-3238]